MFRALKKVILNLEKIRRNFLWGGLEDTHKINWVAWRKVVMPKEYGGLGVGCLRIQNLALIAKWLWRWRMEPKALWVKCIKAIHRLDNSADEVKANRVGIGPWAHFLKAERDLSGVGVYIREFLVRSVGVGDKTRFWRDAWFGKTPLCSLFPDLYALEMNKSCLINERVIYDTSGSIQIMWNWKRKKLSDKEKDEAADLLLMVNSFVFSTGRFKTGFLWRTILGDCAHCHNVVETVDHLFLGCEKAKQVWRRISVWSKWDFTGLDNLEQLRSLLEEADSALQHKLLLSISDSVLWGLWKARNEILFRGINRTGEAIMEEVVSTLFNWIKLRSRNLWWVEGMDF
ncbi:uncharacterized protein LOC118485030 [Helianthus annuus]|uniref:uncharacterized protein LOC118485030 n=1 Tax=Helianthus annuus TaxID=4232 RepID=UPI0016532E1B|nr:uncharacterized protein LOC118485030 [Helianthus annuus]